MDIKLLNQPLTVSEIDFRVQAIYNGGWANILAYKDSRADMNRLDLAVGPLNWKREHTRDNQNCIVSIYNPEIKEWVSKEDTGTESNTEKEKGLASDSFKRACTNWGIGRELYEYPQIFIQLSPEEFEEVEYNGKKKYQATKKLKIRDWVWKVEHDEKGVKRVACQDQNKKLRFDWNRK